MDNLFSFLIPKCTTGLSYYQSRFDNDVWQKMYYWHALPENWEEMNYQDFLMERRKRIAKVVQKAFEKL